MAWNVDVKHSGIAVLAGNERRVRLIAVSKDATSLASVVDFIHRHSIGTTVVAVDASLVVVNKTGQRRCENAIGKAFGRYGASCHSTNLRMRFATTGMNVVKALSSINGRPFVHDFDIHRAKRRRGRWVFEVYPHPAMIQLFRLNWIIRYKKGLVADRCHGLRIFRRHLSTLASGATGLVQSPSLRKVLEQDLEILRGEQRKRYEDTLDAIFCAYLAWYCWRWGAERNDIFGTLEQGYIVVPKRPPQP